MSNKVVPVVNYADSQLDYNLYHGCCTQVFGNRGPCNQDPISDSGKRWQLTKMVILVTTPVLVLLGLTTYFLNESISTRTQLVEQKNKIFTGRDLGELIHVLQKERDQTALYLSAIGPDTKIYLLDRYQETNLALSDLTVWPVNLARDRKEHFKDKDSFSIFMAAHRNALDLLNPSVYDEITFYNDQIEVLITWMYDAIKLSRFSDIWKLLITYKKVVRSKEDAGVERALGSSYFANGGFESNYFYLWYLRQVNTFAYEYRTAELFSEDIRQMSSGIINQGENNLFSFVWFYREMLSKNVNINISVTQAKYYYDNMTLLIDQLFKIQRQVELDLTIMLNGKEAESLKNIIVAAVLMMLIIASFPLQILSLHSQSGDIQSYAIVLVEKTSELKEEKRRTESLLYQMLPPKIAEELKNKRIVTGEYYTESTIFFSEINDFARLTKDCTPEEVIGLLQETYSLIDERIDYFDVYKVENIADQNMIVSGVPKKNGSRHVLEIANMALDLLASFQRVRSINISRKVPIRMGIHSGPVMAGVVGLKLPKYSLFGDTVNTAARMETHGKGSRIHISSVTFKLLRRADPQKKLYLFERRENVHIKGKGEMTTYWLYGHNIGLCSETDAELDNNDIHQNSSESSQNSFCKPLTVSNVSLSKLGHIDQEKMRDQKMSRYMSMALESLSSTQSIDTLYAAETSDSTPSKINASHNPHTDTRIDQQLDNLRQNSSKKKQSCNDTSDVTELSLCKMTDLIPQFVRYQLNPSMERKSSDSNGYNEEESRNIASYLNGENSQESDEILTPEENTVDEKADNPMHTIIEKKMDNEDGLKENVTNDLCDTKNKETCEVDVNSIMQKKYVFHDTTQNDSMDEEKQIEPITSSELNDPLSSGFISDSCLVTEKSKCTGDGNESSSPEEVMENDEVSESKIKLANHDLNMAFEESQHESEYMSQISKNSDVKLQLEDIEGSDQKKDSTDSEMSHRESTLLDYYKTLGSVGEK